MHVFLDGIYRKEILFLTNMIDRRRYLQWQMLNPFRNLWLKASDKNLGQDPFFNLRANLGHIIHCKLNQNISPF